MNRPFVVTVASEKGGVGKTTIATNLAVYLKALREDLPVTIASFDNHFSVDQMFALGPHPQLSIAALLGEDWCPETVSLGQYGVQYLASERRLQPPDHQPGWLRQRLHASGLDGILVLDTRPILDWFTEAALLAADLVLVPVKDRAALVNAAALRQILVDVGRAGTLWLVPSLVDTRARLNAEIKVHEFLRYAATERDYQVLDVQISKSPKVESLASGFSSRILPVLTHARQTAVHGQLRRLAEFVLDHSECSAKAPGPPAGACDVDLTGLPASQLLRLIRECPVCQSPALDDPGHLYFDLRSRRRGFVHRECLGRLLGGLELFSLDEPGGLVGFIIDGPGLVGPDPRLTVHLLGPQGRLLVSETVVPDDNRVLEEGLAAMTGQPFDQAYRELVLLSCEASVPQQQLSTDGALAFRSLRRKALRELRQAGLF